MKEENSEWKGRNKERKKERIANVENKRQQMICGNKMPTRCNI